MICGLPWASFYMLKDHLIFFFLCLPLHCAAFGNSEFLNQDWTCALVSENPKHWTDREFPDFLFLRWWRVQNLPENAGDAKEDVGLIPGVRKVPEVGNDNPLSILAWNPTNRGTWQAKSRGSQSQTWQNTPLGWTWTICLYFLVVKKKSLLEALYSQLLILFLWYKFQLLWCENMFNFSFSYSYSSYLNINY